MSDELLELRPEDCDCLTPVKRPARSNAPRGATWLAAQLGVSPQRARKLLATGRITGARRDPDTGRWDLSNLVQLQVRPGKRGPKIGVKPKPPGATVSPPCTAPPDAGSSATVIPYPTRA